MMTADNRLLTPADRLSRKYPSSPCSISLTVAPRLHVECRPFFSARSISLRASCVRGFPVRLTRTSTSVPRSLTYPAIMFNRRGRLPRANPLLRLSFRSRCWSKAQQTSLKSGSALSARCAGVSNLSGAENTGLRLCHCVTRSLGEYCDILGFSPKNSKFGATLSRNCLADQPEKRLTA